MMDGGDEDAYPLFVCDARNALCPNVWILQPQNRGGAKYTNEQMRFLEFARFLLRVARPDLAAAVRNFAAIGWC